MIEANENIDLVTMRRQQELGRAQESYQRAVSEGRLVVRTRQGASTDGRAALVVAGTDGRAALVAADQDGAGQQVATSATLPVEVPPADPEAAWRHTRLAITAGLVVLLLVIWIWQKRAGR
jgi:hypothetical protein